MQRGVVTKLKSTHSSALGMGFRFSVFHCRPTECHHPSVLHSGRPRNSSIHLFHKPLPNRSLLPLLSLGYSTRVSCFTILQPLGHLPEFYCSLSLRQFIRTLLCLLIQPFVVFLLWGWCILVFIPLSQPLKHVRFEWFGLLCCNFTVSKQ